MENIYKKFPTTYDKKSIRIINNPSNLAKRNFLYIQETGYIKLLENHNVTKRKSLNSYLIVLILNGTGTLNYNDKSYILKKGDCFFIDCMQPHYYQSSYENPWEIVWIHFNGNTSKKYYEIFKEKNQVILNFISCDTLLPYFNEIIKVNKDKHSDYELWNNNLILNIVTHLIVNDVPRIMPRMNYIKSYIDEHFTESITLDSISKEFYISKYYLSHEYKRVFGHTVFYYIISKRIEYSKYLLRFTDKTITEISEMCGFNSSSYFTKQFKKFENINALSFRKKWQG